MDRNYFIVLILFVTVLVAFGAGMIFVISGSNAAILIVGVCMLPIYQVHKSIKWRDDAIDLLQTLRGWL